MNSSSQPASTHSDIEAGAGMTEYHYVLRLYITGPTQQSTRAVVNIRQICEEHLPGRYDLEVIDVCQHPELAAREQIIAAPTLIKELPLPLRRFIGDMSQKERILVGLDLMKRPHSEGDSDPNPRDA